MVILFNCKYSIPHSLINDEYVLPAALYSIQTPSSGTILEYVSVSIVDIYVEKGKWVSIYYGNPIPKSSLFRDSWHGTIPLNLQNTFTAAVWCI